MVHRSNSLAGERRLIKDLRLAEATRSANIIKYNDTEISYISYEECKENIKVHSGPFFSYFSFISVTENTSWKNSSSIQSFDLRFCRFVQLRLSVEERR